LRWGPAFDSLPYSMSKLALVCVSFLAAITIAFAWSLSPPSTASADPELETLKVTTTPVAAPVTQATETVTQAAAPPAQSPPASQATGPVTQTTAPVTQPAGPPAQTSPPASPATAPATQATAPVTQAAASPAQTSPPASQAAAPATQAAGPVTQAAAPPAQSPPASQATAPATQAVASVTESVAPAAQAVAPVTGTAESVVEGAAPVVQQTEQTLAPVTGSVESVVEGAAPVVQQTEQTFAPVTGSVESVVEAVAPVVQQAEQTLAPVTTSVESVVEDAAPVVQQTEQTLAPVTGTAESVVESVAPVVGGTTSQLGLEELAQQHAPPLTAAISETITPMSEGLGLPPPGLTDGSQSVLSPVLESVAGLAGGVVPSGPGGGLHQQVAPALTAMPGLTVAGIDPPIVEPPAFNAEAATSDHAGGPSPAFAGPAGPPVTRASSDHWAATLSPPDSLSQADRARTSESPVGGALAWLNSALLSVGSSGAGLGIALIAILMATFLVASPPAFAARAGLVLIQPPSRSLKPVYPPN
jgi:light-harvesting protein B-800-850 alpha chain